MKKAGLLGALVLLATIVSVGLASASDSGTAKTQYVSKLCVWVEDTGDIATKYDIKTVKSKRHMTRVCIVGKKGAKGAQGEVGAAGAKGDAGPAGAKGEVGPAGALGPIGPAGPQGATGETGAAGEAGPAGADGATGPAGPTGPMGPTGAPGPAGEPGAAGATGPAGPAGPTGPAGADGVTGYQVFEMDYDFGPGGIGGSWCGAPNGNTTDQGWKFIGGGAEFTAADIDKGFVIAGSWPNLTDPLNPGWNIQVNKPAGQDPGIVKTFAICIKGAD